MLNNKYQNNKDININNQKRTNLLNNIIIEVMILTLKIQYLNKQELKLFLIQLV